MKYFLCPLLLLFSFHASSQIFGNTSVPDYGGYGADQIVWIKIVTGPEDSGFFTHYGIYDHPTTGGTCEIKFAIYDDHATFMDRPQNMLVDDFLASPINGQWNEKLVDPQVAIEPSTTYWIGLRFNCNYGSGRLAGTTWAEQPLKYYGSWSFFSGWPDPASNPSTQFNLNNVGLYLVGNDMTLPVELSSFVIEKERGHPRLEWISASEINNDGWNIQRSTNGFTWSTIGYVKGEINSNSEKTYSYIDREAPSLLVFYRLEQVDLDGRKAYSEVKSLDMYQSAIKVFPTIVETHLNVEGIQENSYYQVHGMGQEKMMSGIMSDKGKLDLSSLPSGMYYITIENEAFKIIKM